MDRTECNSENFEYWQDQTMDARQLARDQTERLWRAHGLLRKIHSDLIAWMTNSEADALRILIAEELEA